MGARHILVVDDDLLSREVLTLVGEEAGFSVDTFESGEHALAHLALHPLAPPSAMLVDMQMPGLCGDPLALRLRPACSPSTLLIAMSGSQVAPVDRQHFDHFLLKPFDFDTFLAVLTHAPQHPAPPPPSHEVLSQATYQAFASSMPPSQLAALYKMCLDDADRRLNLMRQAVTANDEDAFRRGAHSIKGGCGMVGALELAEIASRMEEDGPPPIGESGPFQQFLDASARLRSMLEAQIEQHSQASPTP